MDSQIEPADVLIKNHNDFDYITLFVKKDMAEEIKQSYLHFEWSVFEEKENNRYEDILDITFSRPHKIKNKDDLQILQMYTEDGFNRLGKLEKNKHTKTLTTALTTEVIGFFLFICGLLTALNLLPFGYFWISLASAIIGGLSMIAGAIILPFVHKKEKANYIETKQRLHEEIKAVHKRVESLKGGDDNA